MKSEKSSFESFNDRSRNHMSNAALERIMRVKTHLNEF